MSYDNDSVEKKMYDLKMEQAQHLKTILIVLIGCASFVILVLGYMHMGNVRRTENKMTTQECVSMCGTVGVKGFDQDDGCMCNEPPKNTVPVNSLDCSCSPHLGGTVDVPASSSQNNSRDSGGKRLQGSGSGVPEDARPDAHRAAADSQRSDL